MLEVVPVEEVGACPDQDTDSQRSAAAAAADNLHTESILLGDHLDEGIPGLQASGRKWAADDGHSHHRDLGDWSRTTADCTLATYVGPGSCYSQCCNQKKGAVMGLDEPRDDNLDIQMTHCCSKHSVAEKCLESCRSCCGSSEIADSREFARRSPALADDRSAKVLRVWEEKSWESRSSRLCERFCGL